MNPLARWGCKAAGLGCYVFVIFWDAFFGYFYCCEGGAIFDLNGKFGYF